MSKIEEIQQDNVIEKSHNEVSTKLTKDAAEIVLKDYVNSPIDEIWAYRGHFNFIKE